MQAAQLRAPIRVLVVEDNPLGRLFVLRILESSGFHVKIASDGREAIRLLGEWQFDVVLMDCEMPELNGYETMRAIRDSDVSGVATIPIIAITGNRSEGGEKCIACGMSDYLPKPVVAADLVKLVRKWAWHPDAK